MSSLASNGFGMALILKEIAVFARMNPKLGVAYNA